MAKISKQPTESVKLDSKQVQRVREHVVITRQTIGGFVSDLVSKEMDKIEKRKQRFIANAMSK